MKLQNFTIDNQLISISGIEELLNLGLLPEWKSKVFLFIINWVNDDDFILQKTSGSTGEPKEIQLKKSAMVASAQKTIDFFNLQPGNTAWLCLPIEYIAGKMMVVRALVGNLNLIVSEPTGTPEIPDRHIDFAAMVPLQIQNLIERKANFSTLKKLILGGAAVDFVLEQKIQNISTEVFATYGMTETCSHIALQRINGEKPDLLFNLLPGISISKNDQGCLLIDAPELTDFPLQTTDLVEIISPTEFRWLGRADNVINTGGIKVAPEQLEKQISQIIGSDCLIIPQQDERLGQKLVLILEKSSNRTSEVINQLKKVLEKHLCPKSVCFIDSFPRKDSMKIDRSLVITYLRKINE